MPACPGSRCDAIDPGASKPSYQAMLCRLSKISLLSSMYGSVVHIHMCVRIGPGTMGSLYSTVVHGKTASVCMYILGIWSGETSHLTRGRSTPQQGDEDDWSRHPRFKMRVCLVTKIAMLQGGISGWTNQNKGHTRDTNWIIEYAQRSFSENNEQPWTQTM